MLFLLFLPNVLGSRPYPPQVHRAVQALLPASPPLGAWSPWSSWSPCSVSCGQGVRMQGRVCRGRKWQDRELKALCRGVTRRLQVCHLQPCSSTRVSEVRGRDSQCRALGAGWRESGPSSTLAPCTLFCHKQGTWGPPMAWGSVRDGTPCTQPQPFDNNNGFSSNLCVDGSCKVACSYLKILLAVAFLALTLLLSDILSTKPLPLLHFDNKDTLVGPKQPAPRNPSEILVGDPSVRVCGRCGGSWGRLGPSTPRSF